MGPTFHVCQIAAQYPQMLHDDCLVRLEKPERMTATKLLWIPDNAQRDDYELYQGLVLAVGPGRRRPSRKRPQLEKLMGSPPSVFASEVVPNEIHAGDRILFTWASMKADKANCQWSKDGEEFRIISEWQVQAVWPGEMKLEEALRA